MAETNSKKVNFFHGLKQEFSKIFWPNKETLTKETTAVVVSSIILGAIISVIDVLIKYGINFIVK